MHPCIFWFTILKLGVTRLIWLISETFCECSFTDLGRLRAAEEAQPRWWSPSERRRRAASVRGCSRSPPPPLKTRSTTTSTSYTSSGLRGDPKIQTLNRSPLFRSFSSLRKFLSRVYMWSRAGGPPDRTVPRRTGQGTGGTKGIFRFKHTCTGTLTWTQQHDQSTAHLQITLLQGTICITASAQHNIDFTKMLKLFHAMWILLFSAKISNVDHSEI